MQRSLARVARPETRGAGSQQAVRVLSDEFHVAARARVSVFGTLDIFKKRGHDRSRTSALRRPVLQPRVQLLRPHLIQRHTYKEKMQGKIEFKVWMRSGCLKDFPLRIRRGLHSSRPFRSQLHTPRTFQAPQARAGRTLSGLRTGLQRTRRRRARLRSREGVFCL